MKTETQDFLLEIGTQELPLNAHDIATVLEQHLKSELDQAEIHYAQSQSFMTARRLAVRITAMSSTQVKAVKMHKGPPVAIAFNEAGEPTAAAIGFAKRCQVNIAQLTRLQEKDTERLVYHDIPKPVQSIDLLPNIITAALQKLSHFTTMRWGTYTQSFIRPVEWILALFGTQQVALTLFEKTNTGTTYAHPVHAPGTLSIPSPDAYEHCLEHTGKVIPCFKKRRVHIQQQILDCAQSMDKQALLDEQLLDQLTALTEWPVILTGQFQQDFLNIPQAVLIATMKNHQKYYPLLDTNDALSSKFIIVANLESTDPMQVIAGNERVLNARLSDAAFFWKTDQKETLSKRVEKLKKIVFHQSLGTLYDKVCRLQTVAVNLADIFQQPAQSARRAALLSKSDLTTQLVVELPELQGLLGACYARLEHEEPAVASALEAQYAPQHAGAPVPSSALGIILSLADKLDTLVGFFGIEQIPTGSRDPFALRRAAIGVMRILIENHQHCSLRKIIEHAYKAYAQPLPAGQSTVSDVLAYCFNRLEQFYADQGIPNTYHQAVRLKDIDDPADFHQRVTALKTFMVSQKHAEALLAVSKRTAHFTSQLQAELPPMSTQISDEPAVTALKHCISHLQQSIPALLKSSDYLACLKALMALQQPLETLFESVMILDSETTRRHNKLCLLQQAHQLLISVADLSAISIIKSD